MYLTIVLARVTVQKLIWSVCGWLKVVGMGIVVSMWLVFVVSMWLVKGGRYGDCGQYVVGICGQYVVGLKVVGMGIVVSMWLVFVVSMWLVKGGRYGDGGQYVVGICGQYRYPIVIDMWLVCGQYVSMWSACWYVVNLWSVARCYCRQIRVVSVGYVR